MLYIISIMEYKQKSKSSNVDELSIPMKTYKSNHVEDHDLDHDTNDYKNKMKKTLKKPGKTLLVKAFNGSSFKEEDLTNLEGLVNKSDTKTNETVFLVFDTVSNSLAALKKLKLVSPDYRVKFSYYKIFFTLNGLTDSSDYNEVKKTISEHVAKLTNSNVLYCKLYCKDNKYLGCGDLTIDTLEGLNTILSKDLGLKDYKLDSLSGTFYRFNSKKA
jgi:hypothetical protein